jgi:hypothetical protein
MPGKIPPYTASRMVADARTSGPAANRVDPDPADLPVPISFCGRADPCAGLALNEQGEPLDNHPLDPEDMRLGGDDNTRPANGQSVCRHAGLDRASTDGAPCLMRP